MITVLVFVILAIFLLVLGMPLFVCFGISAMGMAILLGYGTDFAVPAMFSTLDSTIFMAIPFYIFAGGLMTAGGISQKIFAVIILHFALSSKPFFEEIE